jgi:6-phosphofructokinase 2
MMLAKPESHSSKAGPLPRPDVLTITPNPSLDLLHETERIVWDDANRVAPPRRRPGGQGINVARAVVALGGTARAIAPLGGRTGEQITEMLQAEGLPLRVVGLAAETRTFASIRERDSGRSILINSRGEYLPADALTRLLSVIEEEIAVHRPHWVACCGSLPPGAPPDFYARVGRLARKGGARFVTDCDGEPLRLAMHEGCDLLVPNGYEAERLTGMPMEDASAAVRGARALVDAGTPLVAVTLGKDGAVIAARAGCGLYAAYAHAREVREGSTVGAGDSFLASLLLCIERGLSPGEALRHAVAAGTASLASAGHDLVDSQTVEAILPSVQLVETL